jgi:hypothetical protein
MTGEREDDTPKVVMLVDPPPYVSMEVAAGIAPPADDHDDDDATTRPRPRIVLGNELPTRRVDLPPPRHRRALVAFAAGLAFTLVAIGAAEVARHARRPPTSAATTNAATNAATANAAANAAPGNAAANAAMNATANSKTGNVAANAAAANANPATRAGQRASAAAMAKLAARAIPGDATIRLDGGRAYRGAHDFPLPPGAHELVVERPRYATARLHVEAPGRVTVRLVRPPAMLRVTSQPPGAAVTLDGTPVGITPLALTTTAFEIHRVDVALGGRVRHRRVYVRAPLTVSDTIFSRSAPRDTRSARYRPASAHPASL